MLRFDHDRLRAARDKTGLTQAALADLIGRALNTVVRYEAGTARPSLPALGALANALNCSVSDFFTDTPDEAPDPRPTELGEDVDAWVKATLATAPPLTEEQARRVSAVLFPAARARKRAAPRRAGVGAA